MQLAIDSDLTTGDGYTAVGRKASWFSYDRTLKRALDIVLSLLGLAGTAPIWLAIAIAIRLDSPGPVFFVQERVGLKGKAFRFIKFRSMYIDAADRLAQLQHLNEVDGPVFKMRRDPRVTKVGRFLRQTSLDELPQFLNVLRGEMSLVGPRPPLPGEVAHYRPSDAVRLTVKPGLTCYWQIRGRSECSFDQWMAYDREYVSSISLLADVRILVGTLSAVLTGRGAY